MIGDGKIHIFFDDNCTLCTRFKESLIHFCQNDLYQFHPLSKSTQDNEQLYKTIHIITEQGVWLKSSEAVQYLMSECPKVESFSWLINTQAAEMATKAFYSASSQIRKVLKKCKSCNC